MNNPFVDPYIVLNKVYSGGKYLKQSIAESNIEPANKNRTVAICYGVVERDIYLNHIISSNAQKSPKSAVRLILKIALYALEFLKWHGYAVVDNAVELTKKLGKAGAAEVDFVAQDHEGNVEYYQVTWSVREENTLRRELAPLDSIADHNLKVLLTMDNDPPASYNGIRQKYALDWLLKRK